MTTTLERARPKTNLAPRARTIRLGFLVGLIGVVGNLAFQASAIGFASAGLVAGLGWACVADSVTIRRPSSLIVPSTISILALWLCVRQSPWLLTIDIVAAILLLMLGPTIKDWNHLFTKSRFEWFERAISSVSAVETAAYTVVRSFRRAGRATRSSERVASIGVANLLGTATVAVVLLALLAAGDAVFASFFASPETAVSIADVTGWSVAAFLGLWAVLASSKKVDTEPKSDVFVTAYTPATFLLVTVAGVLGLFTLSQLVTLAQGREWVLERTGLTFAEYARQGFFQLLWVVGIVLAVLAFVRVRTAADFRRPPRRVVILSATIAALTVGLVIVSLRRMFLYENAFGLTVLRLYVMGFAAWMALVLVATAVATATAGQRRWLAPFITSSAIAGVLFLNVVNPEAIVVERNLDRANSGTELDLDYLLGLSTDGRLALFERLENRTLDSDATEAICGPRPYRQRTPKIDNIWSYNFSIDHHDEALERLCGRSSA